MRIGFPQRGQTRGSTSWIRFGLGGPTLRQLLEAVGKDPVRTGRHGEGEQNDTGDASHGVLPPAPGTFGIAFRFHHIPWEIRVNVGATASCGSSPTSRYSIPDAAWTGTFSASDCVEEVAVGATLTFAFPEYSGGAGCRMYLGESAFTGLPDLATYLHVYDKVEMGWNAIWYLTYVDFVEMPLRMASGGQTVGFEGTVTRQAIAL